MRSKALSLILASLTLVTGACGKSGLFSKSPSDTVVAAYMAANEGKYSEAETYLSSEALNALKGELGALAGGRKRIWDRKTRNGTIQRIEVLREEVRGEGATVYFLIHFEDGSTEEDEESLIKEKGVWKITIK